jgi:membrane protein DedA with SNARE-associated domain
VYGHDALASWLPVDLLDSAQLSELLLRWGYPVIVLAMLLENMGVPVPGETVTLIGGYAAGNGQLNGLLVMAAAAGGAIVGDNIGYWIGRRAGWPLVLRIGRLLRLTPERLEPLRQSFSSQAGRAVLLGRFVAVLRVLAGPLAGAVGMPWPRFLLCNSLGAVLWAATMVSLAWLGGRWLPMERLLQSVVQVGIAALVLVLITLVVPRLLDQRFERQVQLSPKSSSKPS